MLPRLAFYVASTCLVLSNATYAADANSDAPSVQRAKIRPEFAWSKSFSDDAQAVTVQSGWYLAEFVCLVDAEGQTREIFVTEALPNRHLSASAVNEIRRLKWVAAEGPNGPVADRIPFRFKYAVQNQSRRLSAATSTLRAKAKSGDADAQYLLSRLLLAVEGIRRDGLDADSLLRSAADPGGDPRAFFEMSQRNPGAAAGPPSEATLREQHEWLLKAAQAKVGHAQVLMGLNAWAARTPEGYVHAREWFEAGYAGKDPVAGKYLAALLVAHPALPDDAQRARQLATQASEEWHGKSDPDVWQIVAAAASQLGDFTGAVDAQSKAIALASDVHWNVAPLNKQLEALQAKGVVRDELVIVPAVDPIAVGPTT